MKYFLDTNICIYYLNGKSAHVFQRMDAVDVADLRLSTVVAAELYYGAAKSVRREYNLDRYRQFISTIELVPFDHKASQIYGDIRANLETRGQPIGWNDLMIAATVLARDGILVTHNTKEFSRIDGLVLEDWTSH
jgi:tRNA(fMet)-specific endonuclease VapC